MQPLVLTTLPAANIPNPSTLKITGSSMAWAMHAQRHSNFLILPLMALPLLDRLCKVLFKPPPSSSTRRTGRTGGHGVDAVVWAGLVSYLGVFHALAAIPSDASDVHLYREVREKGGGGRERGGERVCVCVCVRVLRVCLCTCRCGRCWLRTMSCQWINCFDSHRR